MKVERKCQMSRSHWRFVCNFRAEHNRKILLHCKNCHPQKTSVYVNFFAKTFLSSAFHQRTEPLCQRIIYRNKWSFKVKIVHILLCCLGSSHFQSSPVILANRSKKIRSLSLKTKHIVCWSLVRLQNKFDRIIIFTMNQLIIFCNGLLTNPDWGM